MLAAKPPQVPLSFCVAVVYLALGTLIIPAAEPTRDLDPAAWGSDHAGKPIPESISGDECLFCHRIKIGPMWPQNRHQSTIRTMDPETLALLKTSKNLAPFADVTELVLGRTNQLRLLKRSEAYGRLEMLSTPAHPTGQKTRAGLADDRAPHWVPDTFANQCAGCHCTGFDSRSKSFAVISVGCFSCHGEVDLEHTKDTIKVLLAQKRQEPARVVMSICGSCHIRTGRSRSTGLSFPNNFVPGDNLFRDFAVEFSDAALAKWNPRDRHVLQNVRDVVVRGKEEMTCLSCHTVHGMSSSRHRRQPRSELCRSCHEGEEDNLLATWPHVSSATCGY
jgi:predicted CXXCH cytochrome family protein